MERYLRMPYHTIDMKLNQNPLLKNLLPCSTGYREGESLRHKDTYRVNHPEYFINYCVGGRGWIEVEGKRLSITQGDVFVCAEMKEHRYGTDEDHPWITYWSYFTGDYCSYFYSKITKSMGPLVFNIGFNDDIIANFKEMLSYLDKGYTIDNNLVYASTCLQKILVMLLDINNDLTENGSRKRTDHIERTLFYMAHNLNGFLTAEDIADNVHLSKEHLSRLFKKKTGIAPVDYFIRLKMQKAAEYLYISDMSLKEIAIDLGYKDYYHFSKTFKRKMGVSPEAYRKML